MHHVFQSYAQYYDLFYADKNYELECDFLEKLMQEGLGSRAPSSLRVLDVSCGTGKHGCILAQKGYHVTLCDLSESMLKIARQRITQAEQKVRFLPASPMQEIAVSEPQDVLLTLFGSICYLRDRAELDRFFHNAHGALSENGLLIFDFYNAAEAIAGFEPYRERKYQAGDVELTRTSRTTDDFLNGRLNIEFDWAVAQHGNIISQGVEIHKMRYALIREMREACESHGFKLLKMCPFLEADRPVEKNTWNVTFVLHR